MGAILWTVILAVLFLGGSATVTMRDTGEVDWMMQARKLGILMFNYRRRLQRQPCHVSETSDR
jgi:hypothetical protein